MWDDRHGNSVIVMLTPTSDPITNNRLTWFKSETRNRAATTSEDRKISSTDPFPPCGIILWLVYGRKIPVTTARMYARMAAPGPLYGMGFHRRKYHEREPRLASKQLMARPIPPRVNAAWSLPTEKPVMASVNTTTFRRRSPSTGATK